jgi:hypothetical protein
LRFYKYVAPDGAGGTRLAHVTLCWQTFFMRKMRQRGGESNRGKRKIKRFGQARRQICEIAGRCMKTI